MLICLDLDGAGQASMMDLVGGLCRYFVSISLSGQEVAIDNL